MSGGGYTACTLPLDLPLFNLLSMDTLRTIYLLS